jgi:hypothetical protein
MDITIETSNISISHNITHIGLKKFKCNKNENIYYCARLWRFYYINFKYN